MCQDATGWVNTWAGIAKMARLFEEPSVICTIHLNMDSKVGTRYTAKTTVRTWTGV